jgi:hypothetical protein
MKLDWGIYVQLPPTIGIQPHDTVERIAAPAAYPFPDFARACRSIRGSPVKSYYKDPQESASQVIVSSNTRQTRIFWLFAA